MPQTGTDTEINEAVESFISFLKQGKLRNSYDVAYQTAQVLRKIVAHNKWSTAGDLMDVVKTVGQKMTSAQPTEATVGNIVRRVLKIIREEYTGDSGSKSEEGDAEESLHKLLLAQKGSEDFSRPSHNLRMTVIDSVNELITEIESSAYNISSQALEHIHSNEIIMTVGKSNTVQGFLKNAGRKRKFSVIVAEGAPFFKGHELAKSLAEDGIETTVINDSAVFAIMSRVNKVIIGAHAVMADGGLRAVNGTLPVALAAKHHSVPLLVCSAMYKLTPQYVVSYDQDSHNKFLSPHAIVRFSEGDILAKVHVQNPVFDYVPPDLVNLFISNIGGNAPSYVYRLLTDVYHPNDTDLYSS